MTSHERRDRREQREAPDRAAGVVVGIRGDHEPRIARRVLDECQLSVRGQSVRSITAWEPCGEQRPDARRVTRRGDAATDVDREREIGRLEIARQRAQGGRESLVDVVDGEVLDHIERDPRRERTLSLTKVAVDVLRHILGAIGECSLRFGQRTRAAALPLDRQHRRGGEHAEADETQHKPQRDATCGLHAAGFLKRSVSHIVRCMKVPSSPGSRDRGVRVRLWRAASTLALGWWFTLATALAAQVPAAPASSASKIQVGGYGSITFSRPSDSTRVRVAEGNLAAIVSGSLTSRVSYLAEFDGVSSSRENYAGRQDDRQLEIARLYAEVSANDLLRLRVGRFLTPIGQWNEIHAEPLTWTAVRPLTTYRSFAKYSTGALVAGQGSILGRDAGYALWAAPGMSGRGEEDEEELEFTGAFGSRAAIELARGLWIGASAAIVRERRPVSSFDDDSLEAPEPGEDDDDEDDAEEREGRALAGFDVTYRRRQFEFRSEIVWLGKSEERPGERSGFVQVAVPLVSGLHAIARAESVMPLAGARRELWLGGLHWRGPGRWVVKVEHQQAGRSPGAVANGWFLSVSSLF